MWKTRKEHIEWLPCARAVVLPNSDVFKVIPKGVVRAHIHRAADDITRSVRLSIHQYFGEAFSMSVLPTGEVFIVNSRGKAQVFDPDTDLFADRQTIPGQGSTPVKWSTQATMPGGDVFHLSSEGASVFKAGSQRWEPPPSRPPFFEVGSPVHMCESATLRGGCVFFLGVHLDGTGLSYLYDPQKDSWRKYAATCELSTRRITAMLDGRALVCKEWGGIDVFDPVTGSWNPVTLEQCSLHLPYYALPTEFPGGGVGIVGRAIRPGGVAPSFRIDVYMGSKAWSPKMHPGLPARLRRRVTALILVIGRVDILNTMPWLVLEILSADMLM